jgi:hypothetical protein
MQPARWQERSLNSPRPRSGSEGARKSRKADLSRWPLGNASYVDSGVQAGRRRRIRAVISDRRHQLVFPNGPIAGASRFYRGCTDGSRIPVMTKSEWSLRYSILRKIPAGAPPQFVGELHRAGYRRVFLNAASVRRSCSEAERQGCL